MGVFGLNTYIEKKGIFRWEDFELKDTRVVVDGYALLYHLYFQDSVKLDDQCGGQYKKFHDRIVAFFKRLIQNRVEPFVLLDGASAPSGSKLKTFRQRLKEKIGKVLKSDPKVQILPLLVVQTFVQTIKDVSGVRFAVCDG